MKWFSSIAVIIVVGGSIIVGDSTPVADSITSSSLTTPPSTGSHYASSHESEPTTNCPCSKNNTYPPNAGPQWSPVGLPLNLMHNVVIHGMVCSCHMGSQNTIRDDYRFTPGMGTHKLHTRATTWNEARKICNDEGGHLAVVNSIAEARVLMDMFNHSYKRIKGATYPDEGLVGIHDLYRENEWVTILGDSLAKTGYNEWSDKWGGQPDNGGGRQNCGALMKEGGLDDVACDVPFPFFCEIPTVQYLH